MVLLNGNKYACETCIKGHRSSTCKHTDRPLFEIKKKGRPVTQCDHCRELRKTKQVHVKCICEAKEHLAANQSSGIKKGHTKIPDSAAFPLGLPEALGASVAAQSSSERASPVSDHGGANSSCPCTTGGNCNCCTPRKSASKHQKKNTSLPRVESHCHPTTSASRTPSHILSRLAELRPVLPRPTHHNQSYSDLSHDPSKNIPHGHLDRRRSHENLHFSPYGRAYDVTHEQFESVDTPNSGTAAQNDAPVPSAPIFPTDEQTFRDQLRSLEAATASPWVPPPGAEYTIPSFPSACGCGDGCRCPGCVHHNPDATASTSAFSSCRNPSACTTCLDCTILSLPASLPDDTSLSIFDGYQADSIDEWIRQVSSLPRASPGLPVPPNTSGSGNSYSSQDEQQSGWDGYLPPITEPSPIDTNFPGYKVQPCCGVLCKCNPEECECNIEDENGYDCRREMLMTTFSTDGSESPAQASSSHVMAIDDVAPFGRLITNNPAAGLVYPDAREATNGFHSVTEPPRSRSSSLSSSKSQSSHNVAYVQQPHIFNPQPLSSDYYLGQALARGRGGPFYTGSSSISSPNLGLRLQTEVGNQSLSSNSSPASVSVSPARTGPSNRNRSVTYPASNPDSDGYLSAEDGGIPRRRWIE